MCQVVQAPGIVVTDPTGMNDGQAGGFAGLKIELAQCLQNFVRHSMTCAGSSYRNGRTIFNQFQGYPCINMLKHKYSFLFLT